MDKIEQQIEKFHKETGIKLEIKDGKPYYGGSLYLHRTAITSLPDNLVVGGWLDLRGTAITSLPDNLVVGGLLDLQETAITSLPDNLVVGGWLNLRGTAITSLPDNLVVGGWLDLQGTAITSLPDNLVVGGSLYLRGTQITDTSNVNRNAPTLYEWHNGKYIKVDGIFSVVDSHHGNVYKVHQIGNKKQMYVVGDGNGKWAHGETIDEARKDLIYKISKRDKSAFKNLKLDSVLTLEQAIECYRVITGSYAAGTKDYVENRLPKPHKEKYSIREIIELTKDEYQGEAFEEFFCK